MRPAEIEDAAAIAAVHVATWRSTYRGLLPADYLAALDEAGYDERWKRTLDEGVGRVYVAEDEGRVVGFASGGPERAGEDGYAGELYAIYILEQAQGRGHGRRLVQAVVGGLREMKLPDMIVWVLRDNGSARKFYERLGGIYVRVQPITIGSTLLQEVSYGWKSLDSVRY
ncbi:MAG TPA: GNAT family N-acetyltransferase [Candidatus Dormibacteraeota bacterium]|nr:GNAT family N-acetyltransferase [Candidatus Dormibacteraeota bacterium]